MGKCGPPRNQQNIYRSKGFDESYRKMQLLLNLIDFVKSYGHLCQVLPYPLTKYGLQISKIFILNFRKSYQIWV